MKIKIMHLYPDLLNLYGDSGNIAALTYRLAQRGIETEVIEHTSDAGSFDLSDIDIAVLGGGTERDEKAVIELILQNKDTMTEYAENNGTILALCGGMDMLGNSYEINGEAVGGVGILDIYTRSGEKRMTGDVIAETPFGKIVGFENRSGKSYIGNLKPLGKVVLGGGNNGEDGTEGVIYKNVIGTHLHGPVLPKNPSLCDYILTCAIKRKNPDFGGLMPLDDEIEHKAAEVIIKRYENK